jgi:uncharacterized protein YbgA (DUF1722 family)/uncharacterized protein YbbK (DUF523 family)
LKKTGEREKGKGERDGSSIEGEFEVRESKVRLGISSCLLGHKVRYDGAHKLDRYLANTLVEYVDFVPVCPEVECGFPVPRESLRLVGDPESPRLVTTRTEQDFTDRMSRWAGRRVVELEKEGLCGYIFKSKSPSSGMERVKIYDANGVPSNRGVGLFAMAFMKHFPLLPVEEDGRLHDPELRENFIERIFVFKRWREMMAGGRRVGRLVDFHTRHKLLILAHSPKHYTSLGRLVAKAKDMDPQDLYAQYLTLLMETVRLKATVKKHTNVLHHLMGYFKKDLSGDEKQELLEVIGQYHEGTLPLIVPVTLMNHCVRKYDQPYLKQQVYLAPHPVELKLRNHA